MCVNKLSHIIFCFQICARFKKNFSDIHFIMVYSQNKRRPTILMHTYDNN